jgi:hypothetical protein
MKFDLIRYKCSFCREKRFPAHCSYLPSILSADFYKNSCKN